MLDALKNLDLDALPADVRAMVLGLDGRVLSLTAQVGELEALNARLEHFVQELNQAITACAVNRTCWSLFSQWQWVPVLSCNAHRRHMERSATVQV